MKVILFLENIEQNYKLPFQLILFEFHFFLLCDELLNWEEELVASIVLWKIQSGWECCNSTARDFYYKQCKH